MSIVRSVGRNTIASLFARLAALAVWFALTPSLLKTLGPERFGFWSLLLAFGGSVATIDLGLGVALSRFVAEGVGRGDLGATRRTIVSAVALQVGLALAFAVVAFLFRERILDSFHVPAAWRAEARSALWITLFGFALGVPATLFSAALQGLQRMDAYAAVSLPLALLLAAAVHAALLSSRPLLYVVLSQVGVNIVSSLLVGLVLARLLARMPRQAAPVPGAPAGLARLLRFGVWVQVNSAVAFVHANLDKFLIGSLVALAPVAAYELGTRVTGVALLAPSLGLAALLPALVHRTAAGGKTAHASFYRRASYPYFVALAAVVGALVGLAVPLLQFWLGTVRPEQAFMLRGLALALGLSAATGIASTLVRAGDRLDLETAYALMTVVLHLVLSWIGIRIAGWPGAIVGLVASSLIGALVFLARVEAWLGLPRLHEAWLAARAPLLAGSAGALASAWVVRAFASESVGRMHAAGALLLGGAVFTVAFALLLVACSPRRWRELLRPFALARPTP